MNIESLDPRWVESLYLLWSESPESVGPEFSTFFSGFDLAAEGAPRAVIAGPLPGPAYALKQSGVQSLIYRYRDIGHYFACTDPLSPCKTAHPFLELSEFGLSEADLDTVFHTRRFLKESATLREIVETLRETYCRSIGAEFMHIHYPPERQWFIDRMEPVRNRPDLARDEKLSAMEKLLEAALFEEFLHRRFLGQKRFSLEGGEVLIPLLETLTASASGKGVTDLVLGMSHRGRLNVLANIFGKPYENIFSEFADNREFGFVGDGDVKYHKGFSSDRDFPGGRMHLTVSSNPSHLEVVDPVVEGKVRARQDRLADGPARVLPVQIHGDAAFAGQGVVPETLNLSQLQGYGTGGTIHIIVNNQIGFTTLPVDARTSCYATDAAKMISCPVFHLHGEDVEAALHTARLALEYRMTFKKDVFIEIVCYRRYGHNEGDEPFFTQPEMYSHIKERPRLHEIYAAKLEEEGIPRETLAELEAGVKGRLEKAFGAEPLPVADAFSGIWSGIAKGWSPAQVQTTVPAETVQQLARTLATVPEEFVPHPKIAALLAKRREAVEKGEGIDWGNAETLAFGTLLSEGVSIRLSGQDSRRGTFNHRHSTLYDSTGKGRFVPLSATERQGARFMVYDSMLSEMAVLGFEYGYSLETPEGLTLWEAQFGDFANGAQVVIDQFIAAGETKWERVSGLVMLLPHGYEGQGAEHSSARIERYLQLCAGNNIQVVYPTTPAQFFHLLRRQVKQPFRKPLVVFTPKSLLRHPLCVSSISDLAEGSFREVIPAEASGAERLLLCSGKVYYDLLETKLKEKRDDTAIVRLEQLYPFRDDLLKEALAPFGNARVAWVQEEPRNMGAWAFVAPRLAGLLGAEPLYVGRDEDSCPAVGSHRLHKIQQEKLIGEAFAI